MTDDYMLDKVKIIIGIEKFDNTKKLIDTDKLADEVTLKNTLMLITCIVKDDGKFYLHLFLKETLVAWWYWENFRFFIV